MRWWSFRAQRALKLRCLSRLCTWNKATTTACLRFVHNFLCIYVCLLYCLKHTLWKHPVQDNYLFYILAWDIVAKYNSGLRTIILIKFGIDICQSNATLPSSWQDFPGLHSQYRWVVFYISICTYIIRRAGRLNLNI